MIDIDIGWHRLQIFVFSGLVTGADIRTQLKFEAPQEGVLHPDQFCDCLGIFLKNYNTLVTSKIGFL